MENTLIPHPDLVHLSSRDIYPRTNPKGLLRRFFIIRVYDGQGTAADQVRCESRVRVWWVVGVGAISPGENVRETPAPYGLLVRRTWWP